MTEATVKVARYEFNFGALKITRIYSDDENEAIISIKTPEARFWVRATKTGHISFHDDCGNECELVTKAYIEQLTSNK